MTAHYTVTMVRPEFDGRTTRSLRLETPAQVSSDRQLAGFLTHTLFSDAERGRDFTHYTVEERVEGRPLHVFTVERTSYGTYAHS